MSGEWLIRQRGLQDRTYETHRVTVETTAGGSWPRESWREERGLLFEYQDGRVLIFPWHNILRAEYRPHTQP